MTNFKKTEAPTTTITRNPNDLASKTGNIYQALAIIAKRSNQINSSIKEELDEKLQEFATSSDNLEEIFENREQIEISRYYEKLPKPPSIAISEFLEGKIYYRNPAEDQQ